MKYIVQLFICLRLGLFPLVLMDTPLTKYILGRKLKSFEIHQTHFVSLPYIYICCWEGNRRAQVFEN